MPAKPSIFRCQVFSRIEIIVGVIRPKPFRDQLVAGPVVTVNDIAEIKQVLVKRSATAARGMSGGICELALIITPTKCAADCVVRPSWPDTVRAGSTDYAGLTGGWSG